MSESKGNLEKFLKGVPQTEELEALQKGIEEGDDFQPLNIAPNPGELTENERVHLRRLKFEPGLPVLFKMLDNSIDFEESQVKQLSMTSPLQHKDEIAEGWAYVAMMRRIRTKMMVLIDEEVQKLEASKTKGQTQ
jgi:hypothetical protein